MSSPKISILLIVKNALPLVIGTLDSLKAQTFKDFEVIVADGASTDGTLAVLHEAANALPLRIVSEPDRSLAEGFAKALRRATGDIVGMLCADERYYPHTLEQVAKWFDAQPNAVMCGGKLDFIDEQGKVIDSNLTAPFNLPAHLACELVPSNLTSFFNRPLIGDDFRFDPVVPTCPDYEYWARLGFQFPTTAFRRHDLSIAQAYRTRDSMSFRAESFTQFCDDKLTHLNNLLSKGYAGADSEPLRRRASAGIHMWAAEQLSFIEHNHPDILAHCTAAARYDKFYERIGHFVAMTGKARYDAAIGIVTRTVPDRPGPQTAAIAGFECSAPPAHWVGSAVLGRDPLTVRTSSASWGLSLELSIPENDLAAIDESTNVGRYWVRLDLEVIEGCIGIGMCIQDQDQGLIGELIFRQTDGRTVALMAVDVDCVPSLIVRSGGHPSSILRLYRAELLCDPDQRGRASDLSSTIVRTQRKQQTPKPPRSGRVEQGMIDISTMRTHDYWVGASLSGKDRLHLSTAPSQWAYSAKLPIDLVDQFHRDRYYWVGLKLRVRKGAIGLALSKNGDFVGQEVYATAQDSETDIWIPIGDPDVDSVIIRNIFAGGPSETEIASAHVESLAIEEANKS